MNVKIIILALIAIFSGCASYHNIYQERFDLLPQHYSQFDLKMAWETRQAGGGTLVDGAVQNVRYAFMYDLEIWVAVLDPDGKVVARSVSFVIPRQLNQDQSAEFSVKLPVPAPPGTMLRFTYKYRGSDGGDDDHGGMDGTPWMQSFNAVVP